MDTVIILYDNNHKGINFLPQLGNNYKVIYYMGEPFDIDSVILAVSDAKFVLVDDRIYDKFSSYLERKPWPLSMAGEAIKRQGPPTVACEPQKMPIKPIPLAFDKPVLFVPSNDTHVKMLLPITRKVKNYKFVVLKNRGENADTVLKSMGEAFITYPSNGLNTFEPSAVLFGNDWGAEERQINSWAKHKGIPTVCLQEGPKDFDRHTASHMKTADHVFVQSALTTRYLKRKQYIITGNPRFCDYSHSALPSKPVVMINANFTYGLYEDWRQCWTEDVVAACRETGVEFFLSRHPRDQGNYGDLPVINSNAYKIKEQISMASIVITRFSTVLYESLLLGRQVLYYEPTRVNIKLFKEAQTDAIAIANTADQLTNKLGQIINNKYAGRADKDKEFITLHCGIQDGRTVERCVTALAAVANRRIWNLETITRFR